MCFLDSVYKILIISTIVDVFLIVFLIVVYKTLIISTIVDSVARCISPESIRHL